MLEGWPWLDDLIAVALREDIGRGDITTEALLARNVRMTGTLIACEEIVLAGLPVAERVWRGEEVQWANMAAEGERVACGSNLARISGPAWHLLSRERVALNLLQRMTGIATLTASFVHAVEGFPAVIVDTRKTVPGLRVLDKYAVRMGGGRNHRLGLDDGVLIKDNHIKAAGGITEAVTGIRGRIPFTLKIEVEVENLAQVDEALAAGVDIIMLDNMDLRSMAEAVGKCRGRVLVEASGGISLERVREVAATGVDIISVGALTHSVRAADISFELLDKDGIL